MDTNMLGGYLLLVAGWLLFGLIPLGVYTLIAMRARGPRYLWASIAMIAIGVFSFPVWMPFIAVSLMLAFGSSFS